MRVVKEDLSRPLVYKSTNTSCLLHINKTLYPQTDKSLGLPFSCAILVLDIISCIFQTITFQIKAEITFWFSTVVQYVGRTLNAHNCRFAHLAPF